MKRSLIILAFLICSKTVWAWGFIGHQLINRAAVFSLPKEMIPFYKSHITYITVNAVNPDKRRYLVEEEGPRHYIDLDEYDPYFADSAVYKLPRYWSQALKVLPKDTLLAYGIVPWHIQKMYRKLEDAFVRKDGNAILKISTELGHYIADANVPLHTTKNYNGQLTGQRGIHGFWESRLPELFASEYDLMVGKASFVENTQLRAWEAVTQAHHALDSVLTFEKTLTETFSPDQKYGFEYRNQILIKTYTPEFATMYHDMLGGQVERRMRQSIKMIADFWYTAWVNAGQPDLSHIGTQLSKTQKITNRLQQKYWDKVKSRHQSHMTIKMSRDPLKVRGIDHLYRKQKQRLIKEQH